jgi:hypothetical protein
MALTAARHLDSFPDPQIRTFKVKGSTTVHKGALVGITTAGFARGLVAGDAFVGIAYETIANAGADGAREIRVYTQGDFIHALIGTVQADVGRPVFGVADDALTLTGSSYVGVVQGLVKADEIILRIDPLRRLVKTLSYQVEDLAANGDIAARAIHSFAAQATVVAARIVSQGTAAGIDAASKTYNDATPFPAANAANSLGALTNNFAAAGAILTLAVTQGTNANAPAFVVEVDYI